MDTKRRSYDIYDIEERVHNLELSGGGGGGGSSFNFSTEETATGHKWIDGRDVYCRVKAYETPLSWHSGDISTGFDTTGIDQILEMWVVGKDQAQYGYGNNRGWGWRFDANNDLLIYSQTGASPVAIVVFYIKEVAPTKTKRSSKK